MTYSKSYMSEKKLMEIMLFKILVTKKILRKNMQSFNTTVTRK